MHEAFGHAEDHETMVAYFVTVEAGADAQVTASDLGYARELGKFVGQSGCEDDAARGDRVFCGPHVEHAVLTGFDARNERVPDHRAVTYDLNSNAREHLRGSDTVESRKFSDPLHRKNPRRPTVINDGGSSGSPKKERRAEAAYTCADNRRIDHLLHGSIFKRASSWRKPHCRIGKAWSITKRWPHDYEI